jgi:cation transport ATPase
MDLEELKSLWQQYDHKLNSLEKLNKKLVMETLSKKSQSKLDWMRNKTLLAVILTPILLIVVFYPYLKIENIDWKFILGWILTLTTVIYVAYTSFKSFMILKEINIGVDPIIESVKKVNDYKAIIISRQKYVWITYPALFAGVLLIAWRGFRFDPKTIFFMVGLFVMALVLGIKQLWIQHKKIEDLENEISDLKEYTDN